MKKKTLLVGKMWNAWNIIQKKDHRHYLLASLIYSNAKSMASLLLSMRGGECCRTHLSLWRKKQACGNLYMREGVVENHQNSHGMLTKGEISHSQDFYQTVRYPGRGCKLWWLRGPADWKLGSSVHKEPSLSLEKLKFLHLLYWKNWNSDKRGSGWKSSK